MDPRSELGLPCHEAADTDADQFSHYGKTIATVVTPLDCSRCHTNEFAEFSEMYVLTTGELESDEGRLNAWWELATLLRHDVAPRTQIVGVALEQAFGFEVYPWTDNVYDQAQAWGQLEFADSLMAIATQS